MARLSRLYAPNLAQLVSAQFAPGASRAMQTDATLTYRLILDWLGQSAALHQVKVQGWSLSPRRLVLLMTPADRVGIPRVIQDLGRRLAGHLKTGTIFDGRYHSTIPEPGRWIIATLLWLERTAVREGLVSEPGQWVWCSSRAHTEGADPHGPWLQPHNDYWLCGNTPFARQASYAAQLSQGNTPQQDEKIETCLTGQWALGSDAFLTELGELATRRVSPAPRGRPKKVQ